MGSNLCRVIASHPGLGSVIRHVRTSTDDVALPYSACDLTVALDLLRASTRELRLLFEHVSPHIVVNCTGATVGDEAALEAANVLIVERLLAVLVERPGVCLVQMGSAAEYGVTEPGRPVSEADMPNPGNAYGSSKLAATRLVLDAVADRGLRATVLRVFNPVGPGAPDQTLPGRALRELRMARAADHPEVRLGSLDHFRDFVDVRDVAWAALAAAATPASSGHVLNVGRGEAVQSRELVRSMARAGGYHGSIVESARGSNRSAGLDWQQADITSITRVLPWVPRHSVADAAAQMWEIDREVSAA